MAINYSKAQNLVGSSEIQYPEACNVITGLKEQKRVNKECSEGKLFFSSAIVQVQPNQFDHYHTKWILQAMQRFPPLFPFTRQDKIF